MMSVLRAPGGRAPISPNTTSPSILRYHSMWVNPSVKPSAFNTFAPSSNYQTVGASVFAGNRINFLQNAYDIEATMVQKKSSIVAFGGGRPGIAVIQLNKFTPIL